jgi:hypothetical protein
MRSLLLSLLSCSLMMGAVTYVGSGGTNATRATACPSGNCTAVVSCTANVGTQADVETALTETDSASLVDVTVTFPAGCVFDIPSGSQHVKIYKRANTGWLELTTDQAAKLPNSGTRVTPAYISLMPEFRMTQNAKAVFALAGSETTGGAERVKFRGLYFSGVAPSSGTYSTSYSRGPLQFGVVSSVVNDDFDSTDLTTPANQPTDIIVQHCVLLNQPYRSRVVVRMISAHSRNTTIRDNHIDGAIATNADGQGIVTFNGTGPMTIENNYINGSAENLFAGGVYGAFDQVRVDGATVRWNYLPHIPEREKAVNWTANTLVYAGKRIRPVGDTASGRYFVATNTGCTGGSEPTWVTTVAGSSTTVDGVYADCIAGTTPVTWRYQSTNFKPLIKNCYELKTGNNWLFQYNMCDGMWDDQAVTGAGQETAINIKTENHALEVGTLSTSVGDAVTVGQVWFTPGGSRDVTVTVAGTTDPATVSAFNTAPINTTVTSGTASFIVHTADQCDVAYSPWPHCYAAHTTNASILNNIVKVQGGGHIKFSRGIGAVDMGNHVVRNNLFYSTDTPDSRSGISALYITFGGSILGGTANGTWHDLVYEHNTHITPRAWPSRAVYSEDGSGTPNLTNSRIRYNIFARGTAAGLRANGGSDGAASTPYVPGCTSCTAAQWDRNAFIGGAFTNYPANTLTNCSTASACITTQGVDIPWTYTGAQSSGTFSVPLLRDYARGKWYINASHAWGRNTGYAGQDVGADLTQLPAINNLVVTPTDRMALFQWSVTAVNKDIPCVLEVHTMPSVDVGDGGAYVAEFANMGTYYRQDADDFDGNLRSGLRRMNVAGRSVNLTANTRYFYRLSCGGEVRWGNFATLPALSGNSTLTVRAATNWGTTYSRATDSVSGGGAFTCGVRCTASVPRGSVVFYDGKVRAIQ